MGMRVCGLGNSEKLFRIEKALYRVSPKFYFIGKKIYKAFSDPQKCGLVNKRVRSYDIENLEIFNWIEIETVNRCNGKCSFCPVNATAPQREYKKMDSNLFYKIIDELEECRYAGNLNLFSNNEPFLDERLAEFAKYAREKLPKAIIYVLTNGLLLTIEKCAEILPYIDVMIIDNYNDGFEMNDAVKEIYERQDELGDLNNKITISMRLENEVLSSRGGTSPNKKSVKVPNTSCTLPFMQFVVRPDGKVSLCCNDALGQYTMGDINIQSMKEIWESDNYYELRKKIKQHGRKGHLACEKCDFVSVEHF